MISEQTINLIRSAKKIAIAIADEMSGDQIGASLGLLNFLVAPNKKVDFLFNGKLPPKFSFLAPYIPEEKSENPTDSPDSTKTGKLRDFIISLNAKRHGVEEIRYEKNGDMLSVILGVKHDVSAADITVKSADDFDLVISFGTQKREAVRAKAGTNAPRLANVQFLSLSREIAPETGINAAVSDASAQSWCELTWNIIAATDDGKTISETAATPLLAGLFSATENLQSPKTTVASAKLASLLIEHGAKQELVREHLENKRVTPAPTLSLMQLWGRALSRSRMDEQNGVLWSFIPAEDFLKTGSTSQNMPFIFSQMERLIFPRTAFLYVFENPHKNHIRAILKSDNASLLSRAAQHEAGLPVRDAQTGEISKATLVFHKSFASFAEAEEHLRDLLAKVIQ